ncbi:transmembrane protein 179-like [Saccoglossus kowalevskii]|uniref:Uncharacterized protein LOC100367187 n=1 Tax=Saccoglossus kowalevskii TaxID=10224 RepID=A0ABM0H0A6_SACKO|nr:PREDICTED: uncharacterized protein LOC100367187 [Saccoglossus kowalevskii]
MGIGNILLLSQVTAYVLLFLLSFFIIVPSGVNLNNFDGNCALFATGTWHENKTTRHPYFSVDYWGDQSMCNFTIYIGILSMLVSFIFVVRLSIFLFREDDSSFLGAFLTLVINSFITVLLFSDCLVVTLGFNHFCDQLVKSPGSAISKCEMADLIQWDVDPLIVTSGMVVFFGMTEFGLWMSWITWLCLLIMSTVKIWRYSQHESFLRSMKRERERLFGHYSDQTQII